MRAHTVDAMKEDKQRSAALPTERSAHSEPVQGLPEITITWDFITTTILRESVIYGEKKKRERADSEHLQGAKEV